MMNLKKNKETMVSAAFQIEKFEIKFANEEHRQFYHFKLRKMGYRDCYQKSIFYLLGLSDITRRYVNQIYDMETGCIKPECLRMAWQTEISRKIIRLAFNLYTDRILIDQLYNKEDILNECGQYSVSSIFSCEYAPYFWEGVRIRYPEYAHNL